MINDGKDIQWKKIFISLGICIILVGVLIAGAVLVMSSNASVAAVPGAFEMRIQTEGGQSAHVLYGDDVKVVGGPTSYVLEKGSTEWGVSLALTDAGAQKFRQACIDNGAASDPQAHNILIILGDQTVYSKPLSTELAGNIETKPVDTIMVSTGTGDQGKNLADKLIASLQAK